MLAGMGQASQDFKDMLKDVEQVEQAFGGARWLRTSFRGASRAWFLVNCLRVRFVEDAQYLVYRKPSSDSLSIPFDDSEVHQHFWAGSWASILKFIMLPIVVSCHQAAFGFARLE